MQQYLKSLSIQREDKGPEGEEINPAIRNIEKYQEMLKGFIDHDSWKFTGLDTHIERLVEKSCDDHIRTQHRKWDKVKWSM